MVPTTSTGQMRQLVEDLQTLEDKLRQGGGPKRIEKQHRDGKLTARERIAKLLDPGRDVSRDRAADRLRPIRRASSRRRSGHGRGQDRRPSGDRGCQRCNREGRGVVAGNHHQDSARAGNRDAQSRADRLSGGFGRRESAVAGRHFPGTIRRGAHLLLQLADAAADCMCRRSRR